MTRETVCKTNISTKFYSFAHAIRIKEIYSNFFLQFNALN